MLLIGSVAAKSIFHDFREPRNDIDIIASLQEAKQLESIAESVDGSNPKKKDLTIRGKHVEVEIALPGTTALELIPHYSKTILVEPIGLVNVADPNVLFLLKKSHVAFNLNWTKNFRDYRFLLSKGCYIPGYLADTFEKRVSETKERIKFVDHDFDVANEDFFRESVKRHVEHDSIHEAVKFGDAPLFKKIKNDMNKAEISFPLFNSLPFQEKIWNMQEECMALACERHIIPAFVSGKPFSEKTSTKTILYEMCHNFLPFEFRFFAIDFFNDIYDSIPWGFSDKVLQLVKN